MKLRDLFESDRPFASGDSILRAVRLYSRTASSGPENFARAKALLIYEAPKEQQTWLVATDAALYCVIDLPSEEKPRVRWRIRTPAGSNGPPIYTDEKEPKSSRTGVVHIGDKRPRSYSKKFFTDMSIERRIRRLILQAKVD